MVTATAIAGFCLLWGYQDGVRGNRLVAIPLVAGVLAFVGMKLLFQLADRPALQARSAYVAAMFLVIGGPLGALFVLERGSDDPWETAALATIGGFALLAILLFSTSPRRSGGWLMRLTAKRMGGLLCPYCGMATKGPRCSWCGRGVEAR
jgi:peptidoglycan/LPS O-acetylase OafA/YrhL